MNKLFFVSILVILYAVAAFGQGRLTVRVAAETVVDGEIVRLGNISEIEGDAGRCDRLKNVSLGYAPNIGAMRELGREQILLAISAAGFTSAEIALDAPAKALVRREGQTVALEQFRGEIEKYLTDKFANDRATVRIRRLDLPGNLAAPKGTLEIRPNYAGIQNFFQPFILPIEVRVDGQVYRRLSANVEIEAFADLLVAAKDLAANQKISETDVKTENRRITKPLANYLRDPQKLRGLVLIKSLDLGSEITLDSFVSTTVVKVGDAVRVEARSGSLKIIISGEARTSGRIGDRIAVKNLQSGSIIQAVVVDEGLVRVLF